MLYFISKFEFRYEGEFKKNRRDITFFWGTRTTDDFNFKASN